MGTYNTFSILKDCADKIVKFKQDVSIEVAHRRGKIPDEHFQNVKGGMCAAFAMQWLAQRILAIGLYTRGKGIRSEEHEGNIKIVTESIDAYLAYENNYQVDKSVQKLAEGYGLELDPSKKHFERNMTALATYYQSNLKAGEGVYIHVVLKDTNHESHALAMYHDDKNRHHFFDPNVGEYRIHEGMDAVFYETYLDLVKAKLKWEYAFSKGYPVS